MAIPQLPSVPPEFCPLCEGKLEPVTLQIGGGTLSAKFFQQDKMFASRSYLTGVACVDCGHVLAFLENRGILAPGK
ncbi:hypothetical protein [Streptomyces sp. HUAS TT7]|uniref:hypothetical protein n=1 Tax=Streptomyces sp. HUAS TT7 TaxID=3447507 RepID=UPI003F659F88